MFTAAAVVALITPGIDPVAGPVWLRFAVLGGVLITLEFPADGTVGVPTGRIGGRLRGRQAARRRIDAATGSLFIGLGVALATER